MKYCQNCSNLLLDAAVICPKCGFTFNTPIYHQSELYQSFNNQPLIDNESSSTANCALLFAFLSPIIGFTLGLIGLCKYKRSPNYTKRCIIAIILSVLRITLAFAIFGFELFMTITGV